MTATLQLSEFDSKKFRFWAFVSMFLLVFVHGYNLTERYMQPWTTPSDTLTATSFIEYFLANGIFRFRIPMLFIISGYLFAMHDYRPYRERMRKRLRTLLVPYLIWSAVGLAFTYALELVPYTRAIVEGSGIVRIDDHRAILHDYHWYELTARLFLFPVPYQLWFIRVLLIYNLAYPGIAWCMQHKVARRIFFSVALLMWLGTMSFVLFDGEGLVFFSLGVWMQKTGFSIDHPRRWLNPRIWGTVFFSVAAAKTLLAFGAHHFPPQAVWPVLTLLHKLTVFSGLIFAWYGCNGLVSWFMEKRWFVWLSAFAFIIYAVHAPLVAYTTDAVFAVVKGWPMYRLICFVFIPLIVITFAVSLGALLRRIMPGTYGLLTGGRGFGS